MRHKKLTIPKPWMGHCSHCYSITVLLYKVHWTEVKHPVVISCHPHSCLWIAVTIPSSFPFFIQPLTKVTVWISIWSKSCISSFVFLICQCWWSEIITSLKNRWMCYVYYCPAFLISWQFWNQWSVLRHHPFNKGYIIYCVPPLLLHFLWIFL